MILKTGYHAVQLGRHPFVECIQDPDNTASLLLLLFPSEDDCIDVFHYRSISDESFLKELAGDGVNGQSKSHLFPSLQFSRC